MLLTSIQRAIKSRKRMEDRKTILNTNTGQLGKNYYTYVTPQIHYAHRLLRILCK